MIDIKKDGIQIESTGKCRVLSYRYKRGKNNKLRRRP